MKIGFDNDKYLKIQSEHIKERIGQFGLLQMKSGLPVGDNPDDARYNGPVNGKHRRPT